MAHIPESSTMRPTWDEYFGNLANEVSKRSTCTRRQVGAVLVNADNEIVGSGYNGSPSGTPHCIDGACPRGQLTYEEQPAFVGYGNCIAVHAEINAIQQFIKTHRLPLPDQKSLTLYINCRPCEDCAATIQRMEIGRVVFPED